MTGARFVSLAAGDSYELARGANARALFGERGMLNRVELEPGAEVARHSHPHEQLGLILSGSMTMVVGDEYVVRMPGPWDGPVRVIERTPCLLEPVQHVRRLLPTVREHALLERRAFDVLHDDEGTSRPIADVIDRDGVRLVGDSRGSACFARESLSRVLV